MNGRFITALFLVLAASTTELSGAAGPVAPWMAAVTAALLVKYRSAFPKLAAAQTSLAYLLSVNIGLAMAQWFEALGIYGFFLGIVLLFVCKVAGTRALFWKIMMAAILLLLFVLMLLFFDAPSWLFFTSIGGDPFRWVSFPIAIGVCVGLFASKHRSPAAALLITLGVFSISMLQMSLLYEQGDGTAAHLVCFLLAGFAGLFSTQALQHTSVTPSLSTTVLFGAYICGYLAGDALYPFWWTALFPLLTGYTLIRQGLKRGPWGQCLPALSGGVLAGLSIYALQPYPDAVSTIPLAIVAVTCVIVIERAYQDCGQ